MRSQSGRKFRLRSGPSVGCIPVQQLSLMQRRPSPNVSQIVRWISPRNGPANRRVAIKRKPILFRRRIDYVKQVPACSGKHTRDLQSANGEGAFHPTSKRLPDYTESFSSAFKLTSNDPDWRSFVTTSEVENSFQGIRRSERRDAGTPEFERATPLSRKQAGKMTRSVLQFGTTSLSGGFHSRSKRLLTH